MKDWLKCQIFSSLVKYCRNKQKKMSWLRIIVNVVDNFDRVPAVLSDQKLLCTETSLWWYGSDKDPWVFESRSIYNPSCSQLVI